MPAVSLAVPVASAVVVLLLSTLYEFKKHRQHRSLFGKVVAPGPFEDTTLLVTDIQVGARVCVWGGGVCGGRGARVSALEVGVCVCVQLAERRKDAGSCMQYGTMLAVLR
mgnify:CR=1 FL=1